MNTTQVFATISTGTLLFGCITQALGTETVWVSSLDLSPVIQGWGKPQIDKGVTGKPISIGGHKFEKGVGTHADSRMRLDLRGGSEKFSAIVGVDDAAGNAQGSVLFKVVGDGKSLWKSGVMKLGEPAQKVEVDVRGIKILLLVVDSTGDGVDFDHADWAEAKLVVTGEHPSVVGSPREQAIILTPKAPRTPRINGPRVFGVRPGHTFLFTIAATGD